MSHSYTKILIHAVWSTKERLPLITNNIESVVYEFMKEQLTKMHCPVLIINGMPDHIHCLFLLNSEKNIAEVIKQVKGSTSHFINQQNLIPQKFSWQTGYAAFSVSESVKDKVYHYIRNQKSHHANKKFVDEYNEFLELHKLLDPHLNAGQNDD